MITPRGGEYAVVLADGTKVWLNAESELHYPVHFPEHEREVHLKGEAYFSVSKQGGQAFCRLCWRFPDHCIRDRVQCPELSG